jgi:hypothetical protein
VLLKLVCKPCVFTELTPNALGFLGKLGSLFYPVPYSSTGGEMVMDPLSTFAVILNRRCRSNAVQLNNRLTL